MVAIFYKKPLVTVVMGMAIAMGLILSIVQLKASMDYNSDNFDKMCE